MLKDAAEQKWWLVFESWRFARPGFGETTLGLRILHASHTGRQERGLDSGTDNNVVKISLIDPVSERI